MDKELFNDLKTSIEQMKAIEKGELAPARIRVMNPENEAARARQQLGMTQKEFARLLGVPLGTVRGWEQGRREPAPAAKVLLRVAAKYPEHVRECAD